MTTTRKFAALIAAATLAAGCGATHSPPSTVRVHTVTAKAKPPTPPAAHLLSLKAAVTKVEAAVSRAEPGCWDNTGQATSSEEDGAYGQDWYDGGGKPGTKADGTVGQCVGGPSQENVSLEFFNTVQAAGQAGASGATGHALAVYVVDHTSANILLVEDASIDPADRAAVAKVPGLVKIWPVG